MKYIYKYYYTDEVCCRPDRGAIGLGIKPLQVNLNLKLK